MYKFHLKNQYRIHRFATRAILVFRVEFTVDFTRQAVNLSIIAARIGQPPYSVLISDLNLRLSVC